MLCIMEAQKNNPTKTQGCLRWKIVFYFGTAMLAS